MGRVIISMMLVCSVLASLALGVLAAYAVCLAFFRLVSMQGSALGRLEGNPANKHAEAASKL
jgi:hypothetical protein